MASRQEVMGRLAALSSDEVRQLLHDDTMLAAAAEYFERVTSGVPQPSGDIPSPAQASSSSGPPSTTIAIPASGISPRGKRPRQVNAFVAFRSYYSRLFPKVQQKAVSLILTELWFQDPLRVRWALIAKVYTFVRDQIGKNRAALPPFLQLCCPLMKMIEPNHYLGTFSWVLGQTSQGHPTMMRVDEAWKTRVAAMVLEHVPSTELELLSKLVDYGYLPDDGPELLGRLSNANNGLMTSTNPSPATDYNIFKLQFISTVRADPLQASNMLLSNGESSTFTGVEAHNVESLASIGHLPLGTPGPDPAQDYHFAGNSSLLGQPDHVTMQLDTLADQDVFDIDNPWDVDTMLEQSDPEGNRVSDEMNTNQHDPQQDFYYGF